MTRRPRTLLDKLWESHEIVRRADGASLLWVDRHLVHEGSHHAFAKIAERGLPVARPDLTLAFADHYAPTRPDRASEDGPRMQQTLLSNARDHGIDHFAPDHRRFGIVHVVGPEQGLTLPGLLVVCGDSHTSTHGALGALAFGIGATQVAHVLATQTIWAQKPRAMRLTVDGRLTPGVTGKDIALAWISRLGSDGARGCAVEYAGAAIRDLSVEARMTLCNMSIEGGARFGLVAPDAATLAYLDAREESPTGSAWEGLAHAAGDLHSDPGAAFDEEVALEGNQIAPVVTWGTNPDQALPVDATLPDPARLDPMERVRVTDALDYMGLVPGRPLAGTQVDRVFIGSCTNSRYEDLVAAAAVLAGRRARVPGMVSPGSAAVKAQAEAAGLDRIFTEAGLDWVGSGCSLCVAMNGDILAPGERCASTTNRNFRGRQGKGSRTHLMSPAMVAAAAITGAITDVRPFLMGRAAE